MDKDRIKGSAQQTKGKVKEVAGKLTGDAKLESEGKADSSQRCRWHPGHASTASN